MKSFLESAQNGARVEQPPLATNEATAFSNGPPKSETKSLIGWYGHPIHVFLLSDICHLFGSLGCVFGFSILYIIRRVYSKTNSQDPGEVLFSWL